MNIDLSFFNGGKVVAVALSGGSDSMALLHSLIAVQKQNNVKIVALNIEHGIRGQSSLNDSAFVKEYCDTHGIPLIQYSVDSLKYAKTNKLSVEQSARILRYECFFDAIKQGKCDMVATAHHSLDNLESVLFNLFRGTGLKGIAGINQSYENKIIRPFINVTKAEIDEYVKENGIPFVIDETNLSDDYTRNYIRHNVIPSIKKIFPDVEKSVSRLAQIVSVDNEYIEKESQKLIAVDGSKVIISRGERAVLSRAIIQALNLIGVKKDWEKTHIDSVISLFENQTSKSINLLGGVRAVKEYDKVVVYRPPKKDVGERPFSVGEIEFNGRLLKIEKVSVDEIDLKSGLYAAEEKIPARAVIRTRKRNDTFTKFGGGTKSLSDYLTDKKVSPTARDELPLLADGNRILAIFGIAVSNVVKADENTKEVYKLTAMDKEKVW